MSTNYHYPTAADARALKPFLKFLNGLGALGFTLALALALAAPETRSPYALLALTFFFAAWLHGDKPYERLRTFWAKTKPRWYSFRFVVNNAPLFVLGYVFLAAIAVFG